MNEDDPVRLLIDKERDDEQWRQYSLLNNKEKETSHSTMEGVRKNEK